MPRTKIICTIGPASDSVQILSKMIDAGMNVARFNFSHGTHDEHRIRLEAVRRAAGQSGRAIALMLDTKGPEIRIGSLVKESVTLREGEKVTLTVKKVVGDEKLISVSYPCLPADVEPGGRILLDDGLIELKILDKTDEEVHCEIVNGGEISAKKKISLPGFVLKISSLTDGDVKDIHFAIENNMDFIAASFIRKADDLRAIRRIIENSGAALEIVAKIENREGIENIDEIIDAADGVMVARGDLGTEIPVEEVPLAQKFIIDKCNRAGKPVITATQMLESMVRNPRPTRAEASDIANAIFDGTDAIMLSGETAAGRYPVESVRTMAKIAGKAESALLYSGLYEQRPKLYSGTVTDSISYATCTIAGDLNLRTIITPTQTGYTAKMISKYRPKAHIIAVSPEEQVIRKMALVWGVEAHLAGRTPDTDSTIKAAVAAAVRSGAVKNGELVVITAGVPVGVHGTTNLIKVHRAGDDQ